MKLKFNKPFIAILAVAVIAFSAFVATNSLSIFPQGGLYQVNVVDKVGTPIFGANTFFKATDGTWVYSGMTNQWGIVQINGWQGIEMRADYNDVTNFGTLPDQPQILTIQLDTTAPPYNPPVTPPPATRYSFSASVVPSQVGVIGVTGEGIASIKDSYPTGTEIVLSAAPVVSGYRFDHFTVNGLIYNAQPITITTDGATTVVAYFTETAAPTPTPVPDEPTPIPTNTPTPTPNIIDEPATYFNNPFWWLPFLGAGIVIVVVLIRRKKP